MKSTTTWNLTWSEFAFERNDPYAKRRHVWIWSAGPDTGKTTYANHLVKTYKADFYSCSEIYQNFNSHIEILIIDEYNSPKLTFWQLNSMCDGNYKYPVKGSSPVKLDKPTILILSNKQPNEIYKNQGALDLILARFSVYQVHKSMIVKDFCIE